MNILYFDCFSGISGDMILGAFLDLGLPQKLLRSTLKALPLPELHLRIGREERSHITGVSLQVRGKGGKRAFRTYTSIRSLIEKSPLAEEVKRNSLEILRRLAREEGRIHGIALSEVHFHEIGALDTIADIVGSALAFHYFQIKEAFSAPLPLGRGWIESAHGRLPLPAPATLALLKGARLIPSDSDAELVTPTGAAILSHFVRSYGPPPAMVLKGVGYGLGQQRLNDRPNALRLWLGEKDRQIHRERLIVLETNIDDMNPQWYDHIMDRLFAAGALDCLLIPCQMKKNRPGVLVHVLSREEHQQTLQTVLLSETTTLGVRAYPVDRISLKRVVQTVQTPWGAVGIKKVRRPGVRDDREDYTIEYEDLKRLTERFPGTLKDMETQIREWLRRGRSSRPRPIPSK